MRQGVARQEGADHFGLPQPSGGLVQRSEDRVTKGAERQRLGPQDPRLVKSCPGHGVVSEEYPALHPEEERQGRAVHQHPYGGVGVRDALQQLSGSQCAAAGLSPNL